MLSRLFQTMCKPTKINKHEALGYCKQSQSFHYIGFTRDMFDHSTHMNQSHVDLQGMTMYRNHGRAHIVLQSSNKSMLKSTRANM
jgi:hypothetical protein